MAGHNAAPVTVDVSQKKLLRVEEAAAMLSIARSTAWDLISRGRLEVVRIGKRTLVRPSAIDEYIEDLQRGPLSPTRRGAS